MATRYLITGAAGMLGQDLQAALAGRAVTALARAELDITDPDAVAAAVAGHDVIVNCRRLHQGRRRRDPRRPRLRDQRHRRRQPGPRRGGERRAARAGLHRLRVRRHRDLPVSGGRAAEPGVRLRPHQGRRRTTRGRAEPGRARSSCARPGCTARTGRTSPRPCCASPPTATTVSVVNDQIGQPTWTLDLARQIVALLDSGAPAGVYHATNSGSGSWFDFAQAVFREAGLDPARVKPTDSSQFVRPAPRPAYSVLGHDAWARIGLTPLRDWRDALADAAAQGVLEHK